jgi:hypothetical protein
MSLSSPYIYLYPSFLNSQTFIKSKYSPRHGGYLFAKKDPVSVAAPTGSPQNHKPTKIYRKEVNAL